MVKIIMTRYQCGVDNHNVYPECPYAKDGGYVSCEQMRHHPKSTRGYCSDNAARGTCPFNLHEELYGTTNNKDGE